MMTKLTCQRKIYLPVTFIQRFDTQSKMSLIFTETLLFPHKTAYFLNDRYDSYKNAVSVKVKVSVNLANKYNVKAKNFVIPIFYFPAVFVWLVACCNTSTIFFSIPVSFFFEDFFKESKEQITIIGT